MATVEFPSEWVEIRSQQNEAIAEARAAVVRDRDALALSDGQLQADLDATIDIFGPADVQEWRMRTQERIEMNQRWLAMHE